MSTAQGKLVIDSGNRELMSHREKDQWEREGLLYYERIASITEVNDLKIGMIQIYHCVQTHHYTCASVTSCGNKIFNEHHVH